MTTSVTGGSDVARAVALQPDGKIVTAGRGSVVVGDVRFALTRHNADGTLDTTFGDHGRVWTNRFELNAQEEATAVVVQPDGKIVAAGRTGDFVNANFAVARYDANGNLDATFGVGGLVETQLTPFGASVDWANALVTP